MKSRQMFIDHLIWTPDGPRCEGPTWGSNFLSDENRFELFSGQGIHESFLHDFQIARPAKTAEAD